MAVSGQLRRGGVRELDEPVRAYSCRDARHRAGGRQQNDIRTGYA